MDEPQRRDHVPDIGMVADQCVADMRGDPGRTGQGYLDVVGTVASNEMTRDDLIALVALLAARLAWEGGEDA